MPTLLGEAPKLTLKLPPASMKLIPSAVPALFSCLNVPICCSVESLEERIAWLMVLTA